MASPGMGAFFAQTLYGPCGVFFGPTAHLATSPPCARMRSASSFLAGVWS